VFDLTNFTLRDMVSCGAALRTLAGGAADMETVAQRMVRVLYEGLGDGADGPRACALVRFYLTHEFAGLDANLRSFAERVLNGARSPEGMKCLTLLATAGDRPEWNVRTSSHAHQAIPLPSADIVAQMPMIAQLVHDFGLRISDVLRPNPSLLVQHEERSFNVFHVETAEGSPHIPAQDEFVRPCGIHSALGFGGLLPSGDLFAVILFSRVRISRDTAALFQPLALSAKLAVLPFAMGPVFAAAAGAAP
jgi:hypothetical protein